MEWHRQPTWFKGTTEDLELACVLGFENELIAVHLDLTSVPPLAVFPCVGLLFPCFFIQDLMLVSSSWYSCEFSSFIPWSSCPVNKEPLELSIVNKKLFTMWKMTFFREVELDQIFKVFPRKSEKHTCDKRPRPYQTALLKTWGHYSF